MRTLHLYMKTSILAYPEFRLTVENETVSHTLMRTIQKDLKQWSQMRLFKKERSKEERERKKAKRERKEMDETDVDNSTTMNAR